MTLLEIEITDLALFELFADLLIILYHDICICLSVAYKYSTKVITHICKYFPVKMYYKNTPDTA